jgi:hypothetical protein
VSTRIGSCSRIFHPAERTANAKECVLQYRTYLASRRPNRGGLISAVAPPGMPGVHARRNQLLNRCLTPYTLLCLALSGLAGSGQAQSIAFDIRPSKMEVEVNPGTEKTVGFRVQTAAKAGPSRETVILEPTDWNIAEDGSLNYMPPGTGPDSATSWLQTAPTAFALLPAMNQLVRITIAVPANAAPGVYRSGVFVQERPPATPPDLKSPSMVLRVRYVFLLYVIVPPAKAKAELMSIDVATGGQTGRLQYAMKNTGNLHVRPLVRWVVKDAQGKMASTPGEHDATVLLPKSTLREFFEFPAALPPGAYEIAVLVNFRDGEPLQSMTRSFDVPPK